MPKNLFKILFLAIIMSAGLGGCTPENHRDNLSEAKAAFDIKDYRRAQIICDHIAADTAGKTLSAKELCRLSLLYMDIAEACPDSSAVNVASATEILRRALDISPDSVSDFFTSLPAEELRGGQLVMSITGSSGMQLDSLFNDDTEMSDSIFEDIHNHIELF